MTKTTPQLDWLFTAYFSEGNWLDQTQEDISQNGEGSAFTDVMARKDELVAFELINDDQSVHLNLKTGVFTVNGTPLVIHDQHFDPSKHKLRLIYFRETRAERDLNDKEEVVGQRHFVNRYFIGWQTTANGKNKQYTLAVG